MKTKYSARKQTAHHPEVASFSQWLLWQQRRADDVGDFARTVVLDHAFPLMLKDINRYLILHTDVYPPKWMKIAHKEYQSYVREQTKTDDER